MGHYTLESLSVTSNAVKVGDDHEERPIHVEIVEKSNLLPDMSILECFSPVTCTDGMSIVKHPLLAQLGNVNVEPVPTRLSCLLGITRLPPWSLEPMTVNTKSKSKGTRTWVRACGIVR